MKFMYIYFIFFIIFINHEYIVKNIQKKNKYINDKLLSINYKKKTNFNKKHFYFLKNDFNKLKKKKNVKIYSFDRNGINVPKDISMFGKSYIYYIREKVDNKEETNLKENEIDKLFNENVEDITNENVYGNKKNNENINDEKDKDSSDSIFNYINKGHDYISQVGNSPKINIYERVYKSNEKTLEKIFENINEVNLQLLKDIDSIDEKEKMLNKMVIKKVNEDIQKYKDTNEIMDIKGQILKRETEQTKIKKKNQEKDESIEDLDEQEQNEAIKKMYFLDKKTHYYMDEDIYFLIQIWLPDIQIDDTLILIDNIEKGYNHYDITKYYQLFQEAKKKQFSYDLSLYELQNIPKHINDDHLIQCEHIHSYNNTYNKLYNYNIKKYTYKYQINQNIDITCQKNQPLPPIILINTKKNYMVQEWEGKNFKNRIKKKNSFKYTRIQRGFRPFSYIDLSNIKCIYKYNFLQIKMKLCHRKYNNNIYPFFIPINNNSDELLNFNGYKYNGDNAWSFFWHNFNYDKETDYNFLNKNIKLNITESKFEEVSKKKSKKIMRQILKERKGI